MDAEVILARLGLDTAEVPHVDAREVHLDFEGRGLGLRVPNRHALRIIRRDEFDAWLARNAQERGVEILQGAAVRDIRRDAEGVTVETDAGAFRAQAVVGADGSNGVTRRSSFPMTRSPRRGCWRSSRRNPRPRATRRGMPKSAAYFDFFPVPEGIAGYTWDFPTLINGERRRCWGVYDTNLLAHQPRPGPQGAAGGGDEASGIRIGGL